MGIGNENTFDTSSLSFSKAKDLGDVLADSDSDDDEGRVVISPMVKALQEIDKDTDIDEFSQASSPDSTFSAPSPSRSFRGGMLRVEAGVAYHGPRQLTLASGEGITCTSVPSFLAHPDLGGVPGVLVEKVKPDSPAAAAGLLVGDVIVRIEGEPACEHAQVVALLVHATQQRQPVVLHVVESSVSVGFDKSCGTLG